MQNGLYKVAFQTPLGGGAGVAYLSDGKVRGGDAGLAYVGQYQVQGDRFTAQVATRRHTTHPGITSVFGLDNVNITLTGTTTGDGGRMTGTAAEVPSVRFEATFSRLAD